MSHIDPTTLPWLPRPSADDRAALERWRGADGAGLAALSDLSRRAWDEAGLRRLAHRLRKAVTAVGGRGRAASTLGHVPLKLLILSARTIAHLAPLVQASALRHGLVLDVGVREGALAFAHPEVFLRDDRPDAVLLLFAVDDLAAGGQLGDAAEASAAVTAAVDRLERLATAIRSAAPMARLLVATSPADASQSQLSADISLPGSPRQRSAAFDHLVAARSVDAGWIVFDVAGIAALVGAARWHPGRLGFLANQAFAPLAGPLVADRLATVLAALSGRSRRALVLDLDDTLWGGLVGEEGGAALAMSAGDPRGEAHRAVQAFARDMGRRGVLLAIASKNDPHGAREVFRTHPDMLLRDADIAVFEIGWGSKPDMLRRIAQEVRLGLEAFVFIDDQPAERHEMRMGLPEVAIPELPPDPADWLPVIQAAAYFETIGLTQEDRARATMQQADNARAQAARLAPDRRAFLASLDMVVTITPFERISRPRIAQLLAKSNQFNLTTRRYPDAEIARLAMDKDVFTAQVRLVDRFGDNGIVSAVICRRAPSVWDIDTWVMSCRVLGRGIEERILDHLVHAARAAGATMLTGTYLPTPRNGLVADLYRRLGFALSAAAADGTTTWHLTIAPHPERPGKPSISRVSPPVEESSLNG